MVFLPSILFVYTDMSSVPTNGFGSALQARFIGINILPILVSAIMVKSRSTHLCRTHASDVSLRILLLQDIKITTEF